MLVVSTAQSLYCTNTGIASGAWGLNTIQPRLQPMGLIALEPRNSLTRGLLVAFIVLANRRV